MRVTYTAQELYEHIRSFDIIEFWGNQNKHNVSMIAAKTSCVTYYKGESIGHIRLEQQYGRDSDILTCCWGLVGAPLLAKASRRVEVRSLRSRQTSETSLSQFY